MPILTLSKFAWQAVQEPDPEPWLPNEQASDLALLQALSNTAIQLRTDRAGQLAEQLFASASESLERTGYVLEVAESGLWVITRGDHRIVKHSPWMVSKLGPDPTPWITAVLNPEPTPWLVEEIHASFLKRAIDSRQICNKPVESGLYHSGHVPFDEVNHALCQLAAMRAVATDLSETHQAELIAQISHMMEELATELGAELQF